MKEKDDEEGEEGGKGETRIWEEWKGIRGDM